MAEGVGVPLWEDHNCLLARPAFTIEGRKPAGIDDIVFRIRCADGRCESQELRRPQFPGPRHLLELLQLFLLPHVRGKELWQPFLEIKIAWSLIAEEAIAIGDDAP